MAKSKKKKTKVLRALLSVVAGAVLGMIAGKTFLADSGLTELPFGQYMLALLGLFLMTILACFIQVIIHEAGHLVFGLLTGYKFSSFRILNLMLIRQDGKLQLRKFSLAGTAGQCLLQPPELVDGQYPYVLYNLGGVFLNLLTAGLFALLAGISRGYGSLFLKLLALIGLLEALLNGIPLKTDMVCNDGYNVLCMRKSPEARRSLWVQMQMMDALSRGQRLNQMPQEWFAMPDEDQMHNGMTAALAVFYANRLLDERQFDRVASLLDELLQGDNEIMGLHRIALTCDRIYCALLAGEQERARELLDKGLKQAMKQMGTNPSILRTRYVLALLLERDKKAADRIMQEFDHVAKNYPYAADLASERELIEIANGVFSTVSEPETGAIRSNATDL